MSFTALRRSMIGAMLAMAAVPRNNVDSSTVRTNRGDGYSAQEEPKSAESERGNGEWSAAAIVGGPMQPERSAEIQRDVAQGDAREHTTEPRQSRLAQSRVDCAAACGIHGALIRSGLCIPW